MKERESFCLKPNAYFLPSSVTGHANDDTSPSLPSPFDSLQPLALQEWRVLRIYAEDVFVHPVFDIFHHLESNGDLTFFILLLDIEHLAGHLVMFCFVLSVIGIAMGIELEIPDIFIIKRDHLMGRNFLCFSQDRLFAVSFAAGFSFGQRFAGFGCCRSSGMDVPEGTSG